MLLTVSLGKFCLLLTVPIQFCPSFEPVRSRSTPSLLEARTERELTGALPLPPASSNGARPPVELGRSGAVGGAWAGRSTTAARARARRSAPTGRARAERGCQQSSEPDPDGQTRRRRRAQAPAPTCGTGKSSQRWWIEQHCFDLGGAAKNQAARVKNRW